MATDENETKRRHSAQSLGLPDVFSLLITTPGGALAHQLPVTGVITMGRGADCDIPLADPAVSRQHIRIHAGARLVLEDLGSRNGTYILGERVAANAKVPLGIGAVVELGDSMIIIQYGQKAAVDAAPPSSPSDSARSAPVVLDDSMRRLYGVLDVVAPSSISVLILGETGVGKEVFAHAIHGRSPRAAKPFLQLNCAAMSETILEGELFGFEKGAFTGAHATKVGLLEAAHTGTLFLDEIGEAPLLTQAKLLRFLETGEILRLGSVSPRKVDVRIVSATNRDPRAMVAQGTFRADFFFRLNGISLTLPPLRARRSEILPLAERFAARISAQLGTPPARLSPQVDEALQAHDWPGNIRELRSVIERAVLLSKGKTVEVEHLMLSGEDMTNLTPARPLKVPPIPQAPESDGYTLPPVMRDPAFAADLRGQLETFERDRIVDALQKCAGNQSRAAKMLNISRRSLAGKLVALGIGRPRKPAKDD